MAISKQILDEAYPIIEKLAKNRSSRGAFAYYEKSDVSQEIWTMCLEALDRYDSTIGPIENYLVRHVTNRMKNLKRDKYFRPGFDPRSSGLAKTRMNLVNALPLDGHGDSDCGNGSLMCSSLLNVNPIDRLMCEETLDYIREHLPEYLLVPFENLIGNNKVRSTIVSEVEYRVAEILIEREENG